MFENGRKLILMSLSAFALGSGFAPDFAQAKFSGQLSLNPKYYPDDLGKGTTQSETPILLIPTWSWKKDDSYRFKVSPYFYSDPVSPSAPERSYVDANEANIEYRHGDSSLKFGLNQVAWGVTDVYNPLDTVNTRRYFDPLNTDKRPAPSLIYAHESGDVRWEALYIPVQLPAQLPGENSRWLPRDVTYSRGNSIEQVVLPSQFQYHYLDVNEVDGALHNNFGGRIEVHKSGLDLSAIVFQGAPTIGTVVPVLTAVGGFDTNGNVVATISPNIQLRPDYFLRRTEGLSAVVTLETAIIRFEVENTDRLSSNPIYPGWSQAAVLGFERNFAVAASTLTMLGQATYARHQESADNQVSSVDRLFDQTFLLGFRLATSSDLTITFAGLYDAISKGNLVQFKADKKLTDGLNGTFQIDEIDAPQGTPLGSYARNDRVGLGLTLFF